MSTSRFLIVNKLLNATLKNGTGGGAPALEETSPYTMTMAQNAQRYAFWKTGASPSYPVDADFDLGSAQACTGAFGLNIAGVDSSSFLTQIQVFSASAYGPGPWTTRGTMTLGSTIRDGGVAFSTVTARYWRFELSGVGQVSIGRLALGSLTDLSVIHSPGGQDSPRGARLIQSVPGGEMFVTDLSERLGREIVLPYRGITDTLKASLETIATTSGTVILYDARDMAYECVVPERSLSVTRQFNNGSQNVYDCELRLLRLP